MVLGLPMCRDVHWAVYWWVIQYRLMVTVSMLSGLQPKLDGTVYGTVVYRLDCVVMAIRQYTAGIWHWHWPMDVYCMPSISICHSFPFCNVIVICHPYPLPCFNPPLSSPYHLNLLAPLKTNYVLKTHPLSEAPSGSLPGRCQGRCPAQLCYAAPHFFWSISFGLAILLMVTPFVHPFLSFPL